MHYNSGVGSACMMHMYMWYESFFVRKEGNMKDLKRRHIILVVEKGEYSGPHRPL